MFDHNDDIDDYAQVAADFIELVEKILDYVQENLESHPILEPIYKMYNTFLGLDNALTLGDYKYLRYLEETHKFDDPNQLNLDDI